MTRVVYVGMDVHKDTYSLCAFDAQSQYFLTETTIKAEDGPCPEVHQVHRDPLQKRRARRYLWLRGGSHRVLALQRFAEGPFLLRKGMVYPFGGRAKYWTQQFFAWLKTLEFANPLDRYSFEEYLTEVNHQVGRVALLDAKITEVAENQLITEDVRKLCCFSGISTYTAVSLVSEVGDFRRFEKASHFAHYLGLCPGVHSSGLSSQNLGITKAGNGNLRRLLIEAAQSLGHSLKCGKKPLRVLARQKGMDPSIVAYADRAVARVKRKRSAMIIRGVNVNKATTAAAREMACFIWGMMTNNVA